jgi:hypothetical protein
MGIISIVIVIIGVLVISLTFFFRKKSVEMSSTSSMPEPQEVQEFPPGIPNIITNEKTYFLQYLVIVNVK